MNIGYLTFGRDDLGYGLAVCLSKIDKNHKVYRITPKTAKLVDVLLFSLFWWEHQYLLADFLRKAGIKKEDKNRPRIIIGGFNTFNPVPMLAYADAIIVGDGEEIISEVIGGNYGHPSVLTDGKKSVKWCNVKIIEPFSHTTNDVTRIEVARGCKFKCSFCAVSALKPYREADICEIEKEIDKCKTKRIALFAPEPTLHSNNNRISERCEGNGLLRMDTDVRLDRIGKRADDSSVVRVGIEGISERLRKSVNKGYGNEQIIDAVRVAIEAGRGGMFMYFILDLPGEQEEDWLEFEKLLNDIGSLKGAESFLLKPSPSVFMPSPHTKMENCGIRWDRDCREQWTQFFRPVKGKHKWNVLMAERTRVFGPYSRLLSMMATRAGAEFYEVERELAKNGAIAYNKTGLVAADKEKIKGIMKDRIDLYCGETKTGPWKIVTMEERT